MDNLSGYANRPFPFVIRYLRRRLGSHIVILASVVVAVACSVGTQYGVKSLVDGLSAGPTHADSVWLAFVFLMSLIAADNFLWRIASWTASFTFVGVTGDLRRDIFRHLTGHAPSYFSDRLPGMLTSRITATSNAVFSVENMFVWNVLPPCIATVAAIVLIGTVSLPMSARLDRDRRWNGGRNVSLGRCRQAPARRLRGQGRGRRRGDGRCHQQYAAGPGVLRSQPRARPFRRHGQQGTDGAGTQPALSGKAAAHPRRSDRRADDRATGVGDHALAAGRRNYRRCRAGLYPGTFHPECDARSRRGAGRCHPACCPLDRSDCYPADSTRTARPPGGRAAGKERRSDRVQRHLVSLSWRS